jgi:hypothetical protein
MLYFQFNKVMFKINDSGYDLRINSDINIYDFVLLLSIKIWVILCFAEDIEC